MRVLLVEDDPNAGQSIEMMLKSWDYEYDWVERGEEAVAMAVNQPYDLILLDVMLPGMDGYDVLQQLRSADIETPVILQSGLVDRDEAIKGLSLGVSDYIIKPFTKSQLAVRIDLTLERLRQQQAAEQAEVELEAKALPDEPAAEAPAPPPTATTEVSLRPPVQQSEERRYGARSNVIRGGKIVYRAATCTMDCVVLNLSDDGAAIQPADTPHCPDVFTLKIHHGPTYKCQVCWRYRNKIGVRFV